MEDCDENEKKTVLPVWCAVCSVADGAFHKASLTRIQYSES